MNLNITALALYLSMRGTGTLVTPFEAVQERAAAVKEYGFDGLRATAFRRAVFSCSMDPDAHADRFEWAQAAAAFVEEPP
ncbi:hypothetical protein ACH41H_44845 [Streptomyces sp. NPDC020800]|uniref:hypothetical protein n=1 Tax=Streptomyces sp. NPDC020800 TaxID=3365092 RepID=UPI0037A2275D